MGCLENLGNCKAKCCKVIRFGKFNLNKVQIEYYQKRGFNVIIDNPNISILELFLPCPNLDVDNKCLLQDKDKPKLCIDYPLENKQNQYYIPEECVYEN